MGAPAQNIKIGAGFKNSRGYRGIVYVTLKLHWGY